MKNRLEELRKQRGIKQEDLASALEVSRQTIGSLENGRYNPLYISFQANHLHGQTEPVPRRMRATLTETEPVLFDANYQTTAC